MIVYAIVMLIQFLGVLGAVLIGIAFIGTAAQGTSEATMDFAYAGFSLWAMAAMIVFLTILASSIAKRVRKTSH